MSALGNAKKGIKTAKDWQLRIAYTAIVLISFVFWYFVSYFILSCL